MVSQVHHYCIGEKYIALSETPSTGNKKVEKSNGLEDCPTLVLTAFHESGNGGGNFQNRHPYSKDESC